MKTSLSKIFTILITLSMQSSCSQSTPLPPKLILSSTPLSITSTASPTIIVQPTATETPTITQTSTPTPPPLPTSNMMLRLEQIPRASELCQNSSSQAVSGAEPSSISTGTLFILFKKNYDAGDWQDAFSSGELTLPYFSATQAEKVRFLLCVQENRTQVGSYQPEPNLPGATPAPAYQLTWNSQLMSYPDGQVLVSKILQGDKPPEAITLPVLGEENYGTQPREELLTWLTDLTKDSTLFSGVQTMAFARQSLWIAIASLLNQATTFKIFDLDTHTYRQIINMKDIVRRLEFIGDDQQIAFVMDKNVGLLDIGNGKITTTYLAESQNQGVLSAMGSFNNFATTPDGKLFAFEFKPIFQPNYQAEITLWRPMTGEESKLQTSWSTLYQLAFTMDGKFLLAAGCPGIENICHEYELAMWDLSNGEIVMQFSDFTENPARFALIPQTKLLAASSCAQKEPGQQGTYLCKDSVVALWDISTGEKIATLDTQLPDIISLAISPDGQRLAVGSGRSALVEVWALTTRQISGYYAGASQQVSALQFSPHSDLLAVLAGNFLKIWEIP